MDQTLAVVISGLLVMSAIILVGVGVIVAWSVRRGLRPLDDLADAVSRTDPNSLDQRYDSARVPTEMQPVVTRLNDLLGRMSEAFHRERRFAADVAHELRTPISELRTTCEVALRWPDSEALRASTAESLAIARQMDEIVNTLLSLVRVQAGIDMPISSLFDVSALVRNLTAESHDVAVSKAIDVQTQIEQPVLVNSDPRMVQQVLRNLIANAFQHTPAGGVVRLSQRTTDTTSVLEISNTCSLLDSTDLPHLTEAFWRKDSARSDRESTGLGLAIAASFCRALGLELTFSLPRENLFLCRLACPNTLLPEAALQEQSASSHLREAAST